MEKIITIKIEGIGAKNFVDDKTNEYITGAVFNELTESFKSVIKKFVRLDRVRFVEAVKKQMKKEGKNLPTNFKSFKEMGFKISIK